MQGKIVSFYSIKESWGATSLLALLAIHLSSIYNSKILCINANYNNYLDNIFNVNSNRSSISDLLILFKSSDLNSELLGSYVVNVKGTNIDYISESNILIDYLSNDKFANSFFEFLMSSYELILLDLNSGKLSKATNNCMFNSNFKIAVAKQDRYSMMSKADYLKENSIVFDYGLINFFDNSLSLSLEDFNVLKLWNKVMDIPYCSEFRDAGNTNSIKSYANKKTDLNKKMQKLANFILSKYSLMPKKPIKPYGAKGLFNLFK